MHKLLYPAACALLFSTAAVRAQGPADTICPRPQPGAIVAEPPSLTSTNGTLEVALHLRSAFTAQHEQRFCYVAVQGTAELLSPTLRVHAGDTLLIHFHNDLSNAVAQATALPRAAAAQAATRAQADAAPMPDMLPSRADTADAPCFAVTMSAQGSSLHFHGLSLPPVCHQDEVMHTLVRPGQVFDYRVRIPADTPPGVYWYHPHPHGYSEEQVLGGASGAIVVEAATDHPAERLLVFRDQLVPEAAQMRNAAHDADPPIWDLSLNFVPVLYPQYRPAQMSVPASTPETWRLLNASADLFLDLEYVVAGKPQPLHIIARDGIATPVEFAAVTSTTVDHLLLPPGSRADIAIATPPAGTRAELRTRRVDTGPDGEPEPARPIAAITAAPSSRPERSAAQRSGEVPAFPTTTPSSRPESQPHRDAAESRVQRPAASPAETPSSRPKRSEAQRSGEIPALPAAYLRTLYFSEHALNTSKESETRFFLTLDGHAPHAYQMGEPPQITAHRGAVEEWTIENRARELHVFHIHQLHFTVVARDGVRLQEPPLRDTIEVPYWRGSGPYPSVTVRLDFSDRNIVGTFVYHCHILGHEDAGMMGAIEVLPSGFATQTQVSETPVDAALNVTARITSSASNAMPTGTVQFQQSGRVVAEVPLVQGAATALVTSAGALPITAIYSGDRFFAASQSTHSALPASKPDDRIP